jgi:hypothetical protein
MDIGIMSLETVVGLLGMSKVIISEKGFNHG